MTSREYPDFPSLSSSSFPEIEPSSASKFSLSEDFIWGEEPSLSWHCPYCNAQHSDHHFIPEGFAIIDWKRAQMEITSFCPSCHSKVLIEVEGSYTFVAEKRSERLLAKPCGESIE